MGTLYFFILTVLFVCFTVSIEKKCLLSLLLYYFKAETVIREQLAIKETANLWCFLGDVTNNITCYEKAWELSNHRSARAQRCLGYIYLGKEDVSNQCCHIIAEPVIKNHFISRSGNFDPISSPLYQGQGILIQFLHFVSRSGDFDSISSPLYLGQGILTQFFSLFIKIRGF